MNARFNIADFFFETAKINGRKTAIIENSRSITFEALRREVINTSAYLQEKGIHKGDRVMVFVPMSIDLYRIVLALFNIGATAVFLDEWVNKKRMEECLRVAKCRAFIGILKARVFAFFSSELKKIPIQLSTSYRSTSVIQCTSNTSHSDTALITFTTGSTGTPKAAKRTHGFLEEQFKALLEKINPKPDDIDVPMLPIVLLINLGAGCTSVIIPHKVKHPKLKRFTNQLIKQRVTRLVCSPIVLKQLARYVFVQKLSLPMLKNIFTGGAPVFQSDAKEFTKAFPQAQIEIIYGSTEAEPISSILANQVGDDPFNSFSKGLRVGIPYHKSEVRIIKIMQESISCSSESEFRNLFKLDGEIGEIIVSGPHVLDAYYNNDEALKQNKIFIDSKCWHRTGDSGYLENNVLFLTGRCSTLIRNEDRIIAPFIYENYFNSIPGVEIGTLIDVQNYLIVCIEKSRRADEADIEVMIYKLDIKVDEIKFITVPRDPRHHSKIDYEKLKKMMG